MNDNYVNGGHDYDTFVVGVYIFIGLVVLNIIVEWFKSREREKVLTRAYQKAYDECAKAQAMYEAEELEHADRAARRPRRIKHSVQREPQEPPAEPDDYRIETPDWWR